MLEVSRSGFYAWLTRDRSERSKRDEELIVLIRRIHKDGRGTYGAPRIHRALRTRGERCSRKRVARLMGETGLAGKARSRFRPQTTDSNHGGPFVPNLVEQNFLTEQPNTVWASDITYIATGEGWLYLATTIDLYSRRVVGWSMSDSLKTKLPLDALRAALDDRKPAPGLIHHSDRGCQYASCAFRAVLSEHGIQASMSRKGNCYNNAVAESFFHTLKVELVHECRFATRAEAKAAVFDYVETFYNRTRVHSTLDYKSPVEFEVA